MQYNRHCAAVVHHINYLPLYYCRPPGNKRVLVSVGFFLFMGALFWTMSKVAEDFLVPALEVGADCRAGRTPQLCCLAPPCPAQLRPLLLTVLP